MIIETGEKGSKLRFFQELFEKAKSSNETDHEKLDKWYQQYRGSNEIDSIDGTPTENAKQVRNITYELIESQVTSYIPNPSVTPKRKGDNGEVNAKSIETLLRNVRNEQPYEQMNDIDERYSPIYGGSIWLYEWDNSIMTHDTVGDVKVTCLSPKRFFGQPHIYNIRDMEYCFITFETTKEDIMRKYNVPIKVAEETKSDENGEDDNTATLYVCYYKDEEDKVCQYVWSDETELLDIDDYYSRKQYYCKHCGEKKELCQCEGNKDRDYELRNMEYEELDHDIVLSNGAVIPAMSPVMENGQIVYEQQQRQVVDELGEVVFEEIGGSLLPVMAPVMVPKMEPTKIPFYKLNVLPIVIRKNVSAEDSLLGQSDCEVIRPQQQGINKLESRIHEKLIGGGVYPIVPDGVNMEVGNTLFKRIIRLKAAHKGLYGVLDLQADISKDISQAERLYDQAKRMLGISDSFQGQYDSSAQSGIAKQMQIQQSAGRLDSKRKMKNAAYADGDKIIFQYYLAYADEPRMSTYVDFMGRTQEASFNRYDFVKMDKAGKYYYDDAYLFATDATVDVESQREALWQENRMNYQQGAYGDTANPETQLIFWLNMEKLHYPFAHDNVLRLQELIKNLREQQAIELENKRIELEKQKNAANIAGYERYLKEFYSKQGGKV